MQHFTGKQYLQIDIANSYGLDKMSWTDRLDWFELCREEIETAPMSVIKQQARNAKEPAQYLAGVMAYRKTLAGEATGYLCGLDATASGLQLLSLLSGCPLSAAICNLIDTGRREDAYTTVHQRLCEILGHNVSISHKDSKQSLMTHLYGSKAVPREVFGEDTPELKAFYQAIDDLLPGANLLNQDLLSLWNPDAFEHSWTLPDGFEAKIKVMDREEHVVQFLEKHYSVIERVNRPKDTGLSMGANIIHSIDGMVVREMGRRCMFNEEARHEIFHLAHGHVPGGASTLRSKDLALLRILALYENTGFMSAVIFEHLDRSNAGHLDSSARSALIGLLASLPTQPFHLICIHDCFKFHANYGNDVRQQYINILAELAESDILTAIATEITGKHMPVNKLSQHLSVRIRNSEYAIC